MMIANRSWKSMILNYISFIRKIAVLWQNEKFVGLSFFIVIIIGAKRVKFGAKVEHKNNQQGV